MKSQPVIVCAFSSSPNYIWWGEQASGDILEEMKVSCWDLRRHKSVREPWAWVGELAPTKSTLHKFQSHPQICVPPWHWHFYRTKIAGFEIFTDNNLLVFYFKQSHMVVRGDIRISDKDFKFESVKETTFDIAEEFNYFWSTRWFYFLAN